MAQSPSRIIPPGARIRCRDADWLVQSVTSLDENGKNYAYRCLGADDLVREHVDIFLTQLDTIVEVNPTDIQLVQDTTNGYRRSKLFLEAHLRQMPIAGTSPDPEKMGAFDVQPYQVLPVKKALEQPRVRLLLADAVGLGKTIQVGMILSELQRRGRANRVLVLTKKSMMTQFQSELWNRFSFPLVRLDSRSIQRVRRDIPANKNPLDVFQKVIVSIDTLKNEGRYRHLLESSRWDVVVIDEAHNVAGASGTANHKSFNLARLLATRTDSLLLTTATPHNGNRKTFAQLISLLDPSAVPDDEEYGAEDIAPFFLMRLKADVQGEAGNMFPDPKTISLSSTTKAASETEEVVYSKLAALRSYANEEEKKGQSRKQLALVQWGLYKLFLSSPEACLETVKKRLDKVEKSGDEHLLLTELRQSLEKLEIKKTSRFALFLKALQEIKWAPEGEEVPRVLVFTEYRKTQEALAKALAEKFKTKFSAKEDDQTSQPIAIMHGGFSDVTQMATVEAFVKGDSPVRILICTDVASEGVNLHHECHHLIHYELPWSIITLIQRNGRIDRYGQKNTPELRYLMVRTGDKTFSGDTQIFERLVTKIDEINRSRETGGSVLKLYDAELETEYVAEEGIVNRNLKFLDQKDNQSPEARRLEADLERVRELQAKAEEDFLAEFLGTSETSTDTKDASSIQESRLRLMGDKEFLEDGYQFLRTEGRNKEFKDLHLMKDLILLDPPKELRRYLGYRDDDDLISAPNALPEEARHANENGHFRLTDKPERVKRAIEAARKTAGHWTSEQLITDQHPILRWIVERVLMSVPRGSVPHVGSPHLAKGELLFCFIGQLCSRMGTPLYTEAHAISFKKGSISATVEPLQEAVNRTKLLSLANKGEQMLDRTVRGLLPSAIAVSYDRIQKVWSELSHEREKLVKEESARLERWSSARQALLERKLEALGATTSPHRKKYMSELAHIRDVVKDREKHWRANLFDSTNTPSSNLVLVIEGV